MKSAILVFPGTNCERDLQRILSKYYFSQVNLIWHTDTFEDAYDFYFLPGGFSYGDYLRSGSLAKMSNTIRCLRKVSQKGKKILGICNGFQILTEAHLLPGSPGTEPIVEAYMFLGWFKEHLSSTATTSWIFSSYLPFRRQFYLFTRYFRRVESQFSNPFAIY